MLHTVFAVLFRPTALVATLAGAALLTLILVLRRRSRKRAAQRETRRKEARRLVGEFRRSARMPERKDRLKAIYYAKQIREITALYGFALHDVGISQTDIDRILYMIREEETPASPRAPRGTPLGRVSMASRTAEVERPPIVLPVEEPAIFGVMFTEAELSGTPSVQNEPVVEIDLELADEEPKQAPLEHSDPIRALKDTDQAVLDSFIDDRIMAIQVADEEN
ncbi:MAG TPA: hypothetical protein VL500_02810 [Candidatus Eisenbacteria bacterium]|nr:hypothetical protein [Candidatus Eisenbacteria bacterium]